MGYMRHHAVIVTSYSDKEIAVAWAKANEIFPWVSLVSPPAINGYRSFFVPPDGSKEGWDESRIGDSQRAMFIAWLDTQRYGDGSSPLAWAEVQYGDDNLVSQITAHSDEKQRRAVAGEL